jgi:hypothetical protein
MKSSRKLLAVGWLMAAVCSNEAGEALGPETPLPVYAGQDAYLPAVARMKDGFLVVWRSGLLAPGDLREGFKYNADIVGCLVSAAGEVLSKEPFVICKAAGMQDMPRVASDGPSAGSGQGKTALVVWQDLRDPKAWQVYGARVTAEGKVLDPDGVLISGGALNRAKPKVAWDGKSFVVIWQDFRDGKKYDIFCSRVTLDGKNLDPNGMALSTKGRYDAAISSLGDGRCYTFWTGGVGHTPKFDQSAETGVLEDGKLTLLPFNDAIDMRGHTPKFCAAGKDAFMVAWRGEHWVGHQGDSKASAMVFTDKGEKTAVLQLEGVNHLILNADMTWDGSAFVAAWAEYRWAGKNGLKEAQGVAKEGVLVSRVGTDGKLIGAPLVVSDVPKVPATNPGVTSDGAGRSLIAYEKHPESGDAPIQVVFRMLNAAP